MNRVLAFAAAALLAIPSGSADAATDGKTRLLTVENLSGQALHYLYAAPVNSSAWEEDILGDEVIAVGHSLQVDLDVGTGVCRYDLKAVMENGRQVNRYGIDICTVSKWTISDTGDSIS